MSITKSIKVPILARVEGEGSLELDIKDNHIERVNLRVYEPPRFFEKFLEGRNYYDVGDITARICGICPIAYIMGSTNAIEGLFDVKVSPWVRMMRRFIYCGEYLQSHSLHIHLLAAPDFLGFNSAIEMAAKYPEQVKRGLKIQCLGNDIMTFIGGRSVHPVGHCIGGFYRAPTMAEAKELLKKLKDAIDDTYAIVKFVATVKVPDYNHDITHVALHHPNEFGVIEGNIISNKGLNIHVSEIDNHFKEFHTQQSTALHSLLNDKPYLLGPIPRVNLNFEQLYPEVQKLAKEVGYPVGTNNMFHSMLARAIELLQFQMEAIKILEQYYIPEEPRTKIIHTKAGKAYGATEAPRGICWHQYEFDSEGIVTRARIASPTCQNQPRIEEDLKLSLEQFGLDKSDDELRLHGEMIIRNYDPCISCSVHFLKLKVNRK